MTLECKVLWVDDSPDWVKPVKESILLNFSEEEIKIDFIEKTSGDEVLEILKVEGVDLIIMDYGLPNMTGSEIIKSIRNQGNITQILFYSQDDHHEDEVAKWEGVDYSHRTEADGQISDLFKEFLNRHRNISIMRGLIIAEAIDLENALTSIVKKFFGDKGEIFQNKILDKPILDFSKKAAMLNSLVKDFLASLDQNAEADLKKYNDCNIYYETLKLLQEEIVNQRNILAHSEKYVNENGTLVLKGLNGKPKEILFDNTWKNKIRADIRKHRTNLIKLGQILFKE